MLDTCERRQTRRFNRAEYYRLGEMGFFEDQRVELIDGEIFLIPRPSPVHAWTLTDIVRLFVTSLPDVYEVRPRCPLFVTDVSEPEPDLAVILIKSGEVRQDHPRSADVVVEVVDTSLAWASRKSGLYASATVSEYWIVDVIKRKLHVHTEPARAPGTEFGAE